jgi:branched-chain amino acid transport system substrate-binding protein
MISVTRRAALVALSGTPFLALPSAAQQKFGPGVTSTTIKVGQTVPYSGPASAFSSFAKVQAAYFRMINAKGGINGRKVEFLSLDDGYAPPQTVEVTRKLVEQEQVLLVFGSAGTPTNSAIHKYMNARKVPQLFIGSGATKWGDPQNFPWSMGWAPNYQTEARIYAKHILDVVKDARIGILYQNDDFGKDLMAGVKAGLGGQAAKLVVHEASYEVTDPTVDSQVIALKGAGANVLLNFTTPKFAAQAIRKAHDIDWRPTHFLSFVSNSIGATLKPAGLDKSVGLISIQFLKGASDPRWAADPGMQDYLAFLKQYNADADINDFLIAYGYSVVQTLVQVLKQCGDDLTRENVMRQAANLKDLELPLLLPGIRINTSPTNFFPIRQAQLSRFDGQSWQLFGDVIGD